MRRLFVTGATGLVGRRLLARLPAGVAEEVACLTRDPARLAGAGAGIVPVEGDLLEPEAWSDALSGAGAVVHLAAATGAARAVEHWRVNARGTGLLLHACERAGVARFVHVSTIATTFAETGDYPYARSKRRAEEAVRESGLAWTIVRPTLVVGPGGGAWRGLAALARLPVIPVPGPGGATLQPVWVDDVAEVLVDALGGRWIREVVEVGGPERLAVEDLLRRIRRRRGGGEARVVHVPVAALSPALAWLDRRGAPLPVTAGQLRSFREDGTIGEEAAVAVEGPTALDEAIDRALRGSP